MVFNHCK